MHERRVRRCRRCRRQDDAGDDIDTHDAGKKRGMYECRVQGTWHA